MVLQLSLVGHADKYHMPYGGIVQNDPTFDEMRRVVVTERRRPHIPAHWASHKVITYTENSNGSLLAPNAVL